MKTITIVAPNIKTGGGKELLEYLLDYLEEFYDNVKVIAYVDNAVDAGYSKNRKIIVVNFTIAKIFIFLKKIENVIYFGNLPPMRQSGNSIVYFHNRYLLMNHRQLLAKKNYKFYIIIKIYLQQMYVRLNLCHIDFVAAQSKFVSDAFYKKYNFSKVKVLPFYRSCPKISTPINREYDFCYISLAHAHKNHNNLLDALKVLAAKNVKLSIALTVEKDKVNLIKKIKAINKMGSVNIYNYGLVSKNSVCEIYSKTRCLVYPSIEESFGLSLVEAVDKGLDVIASRLQYVYEVIEPSLVFDPFSSLDMAAKIEQYINTGSKRSYSKTQNKIVDLIELVLVKQP